MVEAASKVQPDVAVPQVSAQRMGEDGEAVGAEDQRGDDDSRIEIVEDSGGEVYLSAEQLLSLMLLSVTLHTVLYGPS